MKVVKCDICGEIIPNGQYIFYGGYKWVSNLGVIKYDVCRKCGNDILNELRRKTKHEPNT